jgi:hypothetical protein
VKKYFGLVLLVISLFAFPTQAFADSPNTGQLAYSQSPVEILPAAPKVDNLGYSSPSAAPAPILITNTEFESRTAATGPNSAVAAIPSGTVATQTGAQAAKTTGPTLGEFVTKVKNGQSGLVVGVYVPKTLALKVAQQPSNNPAYVSSVLGTATQFSLASQQGTIGLLAHNYLSGKLFSNLSAGEEVDIVYGDGGVRRYIISKIRRFQALSPNDPYSTFADLDNGSAQLSSTDLFNQIYAGGNKVVFQTCINANGNLSWGRLFVIATPIS